MSELTTFYNLSYMIEPHFEWYHLAHEEGLHCDYGCGTFLRLPADHSATAEDLSYWMKIVFPDGTKKYVHSMTCFMEATEREKQNI